jgi:transglutaminase-like putative cysteine protease
VSATALRDPSSPAADEPLLGRRRRQGARDGAGTGGPDSRRIDALWLRLAACAGLAAFGAQAWGDMVRPEEPGRLIGAAGAGVALGAVVLLTRRVPRSVRALVLALTAVAAVAAALLLAGVPARLLGPKVWGDLLSGLGQGFEALPGLSVPYRGVDEWNRIVLLLGGTALAVTGPLVACWPGRSGRPAGPMVAVIVLGVLYAVPAVQFDAAHPFLDGAVFAVLLAAVLFAERLALRDAGLAAGAVAAAVVAGLAFAPALDGRDPWIDYESLAQSLGERNTSVFDWNHGYGPLDWPRDGREVLRVRARTGSYWKATTLADFDGLKWREIRPRGIEDDPASELPAREWVQQLRVSVRNLRTRQFIGAGTTLRIDRSPRTPIEGTPGSFVTEDRTLRRGHAYLAEVYVPKPTSQQLSAASTDYPDQLWPYLSMQLPQSVGGPPPLDPVTMTPTASGRPAFVVFSSFSDARSALIYEGRGYGERTGDGAVLDSRYGRMFRLAQRLRAQSATPYDYVRRVIAHFDRGFQYTEVPPQRPIPLDAFVFRDKAGYCQQFSGAMALLLRMGGVPARVAAGFTPGTLDAERREYVVRDIDAHSWVEAYFPSYGWITFDPTPAVAPPRSQADGVDDPVGNAEEESSQPPSLGDRQSDPAAIDSGAAAAEETGPPVALYVAGGLTLALVVLVAALVWRGRRRFARLTTEQAVAELDRALRRSGRHPERGLTLRRFEESLRGVPRAAGYVRAVRDARYGYGTARPTLEQRRALRRELGAGLGWRGRLRAFWALPPF